MGLEEILANHLLRDQGLPVGNLIAPTVLLGSAETSSFIQEIFSEWSLVTISRHYCKTLNYISEQKHLPLIEFIYIYIIDGKGEGQQTIIHNCYNLA